MVIASNVSRQQCSHSPALYHSRVLICRLTRDNNFSSTTLLAVMTFVCKALRRKLTPKYPFGGPERQHVPDEKIKWTTSWPDYSPPYFTSEKVLKNKQWADFECITSASPQLKWNTQDGLVNRESHLGAYMIDDQGYPLNPCGRTGVRGRGNLGRWGPNHAVDPIVTRWKSPENDNKEDSLAEVSREVENPRILQFVAIQRRDTEEWAIPGGMIDPGETSVQALKREFLEEVFSIDNANDAEKISLHAAFDELFKQGTDIYRGYVDDPRNTDNAWIETDCKNFHTNDPQIFRLPLKAGSDAKNAKWIDISSSLALYASHKSFIEKVAKLHNVAW